MSKKDVFSDVKKKAEVLGPEFKEKISLIMEDISSSLEMLYDVATKDEKTGLYNHRFFENMLKMEIEKAKRDKENFCLIIIDVDFFKKFNDTYGHLVGDKVLENLAKVLQNELRKYDIVARFGGEEFFILLPETKIRRGKQIAERLRKNIWKNRLLKKYKVTFSAGITEFKKGDSVRKIIKRADKALYVSKKNGRNCVSVL